MMKAACLALVALLISAAVCAEEAATTAPAGLPSPDGASSAVISPDGLRLRDAGGRLSPLLVDNAVAVAWMGDAGGMLVIRRAVTTAWKDMEPLLGEARVAEIKRVAPLLEQEVLRYRGPWAEFKPSCVPAGMRADIDLMLMYIVDLSPQWVDHLVSYWKRGEEAHATYYTAAVCQIEGGKARLGPAIARLLTPPDAKALAELATKANQPPASQPAGK